MDRHSFLADFNRFYLPGGLNDSFASQPAHGQFLRMNARTGNCNHFLTVQMNFQMDLPDNISYRRLPGRSRKNTDGTLFDPRRVITIVMFHLFSLKMR